MVGKNSGSGFDPNDDDFFDDAANASGVAAAGEEISYEFEEMPQLGGASKDDDFGEDFAAQPVDKFADDEFGASQENDFGGDGGFGVEGNDADADFDDIETANTITSEGRGPEFTQGEGAEVDGEEEQTAQPAGQSPIRKYLPLAGAGVLVVGLLAYGLPNVVFPTLGIFQDGGTSALPTTSIDIAVAPGPGGLAGNTPEVPAFAQNLNNRPVPSLPGAPATTGPALPPAIENAPSLPGSIADGMAPIPSTPVSLPLEPINQPVTATAPVDDGRIEDLVGQVADLADQLAESRSQVASLEERLTDLEEQPVVAATPVPLVQPPSKPIVVEGWEVKGKQNDVAWVEGPDGFLEVREGSTIPGVGEVRGFSTYEGKWVVETAAGVILQY